MCVGSSENPCAEEQQQTGRVYRYHKTNDVNRRVIDRSHHPRMFKIKKDRRSVLTRLEISNDSNSQKQKCRENETGDAEFNESSLCFCCHELRGSCWMNHGEMIKRCYQPRIPSTSVKPSRIQAGCRLKNCSERFRV